MNAKLAGLLVGVGIGFLFAWAALSDPVAIREMLLLHELDIYLLMGSSIAVAAIGVRLLRAAGAKTFAAREPIAWSHEKPEARHVAGSVLFGAGWAVTGTCPGPLAVMIGEGRFGGLYIAAGLIAGVLLQATVKARLAAMHAAHEAPGVAGL